MASPPGHPCAVSFQPLVPDHLMKMTAFTRIGHFQSSRTVIRTGAILLLALFFSACGQKGDLYLPAPEPAAATDSGASPRDLDRIEDAEPVSAIPGPTPAALPASADD